MVRPLKLGKIALLFGLLLLLRTQWLKPASSAAVEVERQVVVPMAFKTSPVVLTKVTLGDTMVQEGRMVKVLPSRTFPARAIEPITPFQAIDDWIQTLTIYLYNRTNKIVVFCQILFRFPETGAADRPPHGIMVTLGRIPQSAPVIGTGPQPSDRVPIAFLPGQTMAIPLRDYIDRIKFEVDRFMPLEAVTQLEIHIGPFFFADGMEYSVNRYLMPDPKNPGKALRAAPDYFPGDMNLTWPGRADWGERGRKKQ